ncbi:hypothetical protein, partial [Mycobacterium canetti]|uniref:hypothetical protein n=2 Tax=Mycobacterium canetti TaxID=78331 RepID=UPI001C671B47
MAPRPTPTRQRPVREHIDITNLRISQGHGQPQFATITTRLLPSNDATSSRHNVRMGFPSYRGDIAMRRLGDGG